MQGRVKSKNKVNVVTASDKGLKDLLLSCVDSLKKLGYVSKIYDLGGLGFGEKFAATVSEESLRKFPKKPFVIEKALLSIDKNEYLVWIDADCVVVSNFDEVATGDYDIGVTFRKGHLNSGVVFVKNTPDAIKFLKKWQDLSLQEGGDQNGLNKLCGITDSDLINQLVTIDNVVVRVFDAKIYNNFFFIKDQSLAKIVHYKSKFRHLHPALRDNK